MAPRWRRSDRATRGADAARPASWLGAGTLFSLALIALLVVGILTLNANGPDPESQPSAGARNSRCWRAKPAERLFARKMNQVRRRGHRRTLRFDPELSRVAREHTREMVRRRTLYHTSSNQLRRRVVRWILLGENVGVGGTVSSLHQAFMHSPAHRANIMRSSFRHSGVGVSEVGGRMWVTVIFQAATNPGTRLRMPRC
jgi:uncharacterized protein YkwD